MPSRPGAAGGPGGGGAGLASVYAAASVDTTFDGAHALGATTLTLASVDGIRADMTLGVTARSSAGGHEIIPDIVSIDAAAKQVEIAAPGLARARADGDAVFASPLWGADDTLALPAPVGAAAYAELAVRMLWELWLSTGSSSSTRNGRSSGAFWGPSASHWEVLNSSSYWWSGGNLEAGLNSYAVGAANYGSSLSNLWTLDYRPADRTLLLLPADPSLSVRYIPRVYQLTVAGR